MVITGFKPLDSYPDDPCTWGTQGYIIHKFKLNFNSKVTFDARNELSGTKTYENHVLHKYVQVC